MPYSYNFLAEQCVRVLGQGDSYRFENQLNCCEVMNADNNSNNNNNNKLYICMWEVPV